MMTKIILLTTLLFGLNIVQDPATLDSLRSAYPRAIKDSETCEKQLVGIKKMKNPTPIEQAYIGAYYAVRAKHLTSPLKKLNNFKEGKAQLETAVRRDPGNVEIHFLRLTIQYSAPKILGYKDHISPDLQIVMNKYSEAKPTVLKAHIKEFLLQTDLLSAAQRAKL